ncbi:hypothetical protein EIP86_008111 [Pleurotus ostreatoroseus]|nr:hypothetical protein EIP86_008111 [Pleurotus ostreatoroseus]
MSDLKVALVTGCSEGGIGYAFCEKLAARNYIVYATARRLESMAPLTHPNFKKFVLDVTDDQQVQSVVATIISIEGHIDMVINNAGILAPGPIIDYTDDQIKEVYDINVYSILRVSRAVIPHMAGRKKGTIVNMGSVAGEFPTPWTGHYDASKAAVRLMTEVLALECKPFNVKVMLVSAASVRSQIIGKHDDYQLPQSSLYGGFLHNIRDRLEAARDKEAMQTSLFAEEVISKADSASPPSYLLAGGKAGTYKLMAYLPRSWVLSIVWGMFSKPKAEEARQ